MKKSPARLKLRERIIDIIIKSDYEAGLNRNKAIIATVDGIVLLIQNNYRRKKQ